MAAGNASSPAPEAIRGFTESSLRLRSLDSDCRTGVSDNCPLPRRVLAALLTCVAVSIVILPEGVVSARAAGSVTCTRPDWGNPGPYDRKTGLNTAQTQAIECARALWAVTNKTGGKCICFATMLMDRIGADQVKHVAPSTNAGPRWSWIRRNKRIDQWTWNKRPRKMSAPYVLWWNNLTSTPDGHVGIYIGKTRRGKPIYIDNLSRPDTRNGSKTGYWVVGESMFAQRKLPSGVTRNFIAWSGARIPTDCR